MNLKTTVIDMVVYKLIKKIKMPNKIKIKLVMLLFAIASFITSIYAPTIRKWSSEILKLL